MNRNNHRVCLIGLDGFCLSFVKKWIGMDSLPKIKELMEKGYYGELESTIPPVTPPAWTSMVTGCNPGKHSVYDFFERDNKELKLVNSRKRKIPAIWEILGSEGKKSVVLNVPLTYPPEKTNGIMVSGPPVPSDTKNFTYPPSFREKISGEIYPITHEESLEAHMEQITNLWKTSKKLLNEVDWSFFMVVLMNTDWALHDYPNISIQQIKKIYQKADWFVSKMDEELGSQTIKFLVSDHGFNLSENKRKTFFINNWLRNNDCLRTSSPPSFIAKSLYNTSIGRTLTRYLLNKIPIKNEKGEGGGDQEIVFNEVDLEKTDLIATSGSHSVNYIGTEVINQEATVEEVEELIRDLNNISRDKDSVVDDAWKGSNLYNGPFRDEGPDIVVKLSDSFAASLSLDPLGRVVDYPIRRDVYGSHIRKGFYLVEGKEIGEGRKEINICDIAPTILHILNQPIFRYMDGKPQKELFKPGSMYREKEISYSEEGIEKPRIRRTIDKMESSEL